MVPMSLTPEQEQKLRGTSRFKKPLLVNASYFASRSLVIAVVHSRGHLLFHPLIHGEYVKCRF